MNENTLSTPAPKKTRYGRPQMLKDERRDFKFKIGFNVVEFKKIVERAESAGMSETELIRNLSLNQQMVTTPQINKTAYAELAKLASNLNQIKIIAHANGALPSAEFLSEIENKVQHLRAELLGKGE